MNVIDKIVKSNAAPVNTNVLWLNTEDKFIYYFTDLGWEKLNITGFFVGTEAERLALTPKNGYEFNQVEEDGTVSRYFYKQDEWVFLSNRNIHDTEEVILNIKIDVGNINLSSLIVEIENLNTGVIYDVTIDSVGQGVIYIPIGDQYKVTLPMVTGYFLDTYKFTYTAKKYIRLIDVCYKSIEAYYNTVATSFIVEASRSPICDIGGNNTILTRILEGRVNPNKPISGTYVIDEENKKYAKLSSTDHSKFEDNTDYTGTYGNVFRYLPTLYIFKDPAYEGAGTKYYLSDVELLKGFYKVLPESWIGVYKAFYDSITNKIYSRPNLAASVMATVSDFQLYAQNTGENYGINDYKNWQKLCALFIAKFGTTNSNAIAGFGMANTHNSDYFNLQTGITISLGDGTGEIEYQNTGYKQCKLFGIEAPWGQQWEWLKGIYFSGPNAYVYDANSYTASETPTRRLTRLTSVTTSYIISLIKGEYFDVLPNRCFGNSSEGYCDAYWASNGVNNIRIGGGINEDSAAGLFCCGTDLNTSHTSKSIGARLCFYGDISEYELITGTEMKALHS